MALADHEQQIGNTGQSALEKTEGSVCRTRQYTFVFMRDTCFDDDSVCI